MNPVFHCLADTSCNSNLFDAVSHTLTSSSDDSSDRAASQSQITDVAATSTSGFWQPASNDVSQWIQVSDIYSLVARSLLL